MVRGGGVISGIVDAPQALPEVPRLPHAPPLGRPLAAQEAPIVCVCVNLCGVYTWWDNHNPNPARPAEPPMHLSIHKHHTPIIITFTYRQSRILMLSVAITTGILGRPRGM